MKCSYKYQIKYFVVFFFKKAYILLDIYIEKKIYIANNKAAVYKRKP
jgi:hypothetical protein